jgi:flagellar biosynthesis protein FlhG
LRLQAAKEAVGKTTLSANLSLGLAELGKRVDLMDADLELANVDLLLGDKTKRNIADVLAGDFELQDILIGATGGIKVIPASSGTQELASLGAHEQAGLTTAFNGLGESLDVLAIDTAAGISNSVISFVRAGHEVLMMACDGLSSKNDAYALIKILNEDYQMSKFRIVANMTRSETQGRNLFKKLVHVTDRFLDINLRYAGEIPSDNCVRIAVKKQKAAIKEFPGSKSSIAYKKLTKTVSEWPILDQPRGHLGSFVERLVL